jgi:hypothetical protein
VKPPPPNPPPSTKMALSNVTKGKRKQPHRVLVYGPEGIGKSTFGSGAPNPIFLPVEDGTNHLDVARFPKPETWSHVLGAVRVLIESEHEYKTLVIDTLDAAEPLLWQYMVTRDTTKDSSGKPKLTDIESYGYGKGYTKALDDWRILLKMLETLGERRGMHVIFLAHSWIKSFKNPQGEDYDRYELKLNAKASGLLKEWSDCVFFANYETYAKKDDKKRVRGVDTGARLIFTERRAAYDAKNRFGLSNELALSWADFDAASQQDPDPVALREEIARKAVELGPEVAKLVAESVAKAGDSTQTLIIINNRVNSRLAEKAEKESSES